MDENRSAGGSESKWYAAANSFFIGFISIEKTRHVFQAGRRRPTRTIRKQRIQQNKNFVEYRRGENKGRHRKNGFMLYNVFRISGRSKARPLSFLFFYLFFFLHGCRAYLYILSESFRKSKSTKPANRIAVCGLDSVSAMC
ncbi:MAG TPA: hypothetical protein PK597_02535 [Oscillospiraceae bacterium]|nr:hypothetical protein [Oscillospiraceae bacterium]